jgi:DNA-binding response OmpR family regulator
MTWPTTEPPPSSRRESDVPPSAAAFAALDRRTGGPSLAGLRVLLVDDDPGIVELIRAALLAKEAEVFVAMSKSEAVSFQESVDVALVDVSPLVDDLDGALSEIAHFAKRIVIITGGVDDVTKRLSIAVDVVRKPFELGELLRVLSA